MKILIIHEVDWFKKVIFEPHHLAELFSIKGHQVFVIDCPEPEISKFCESLRTRTVTNYQRVYENSSITVIRPPCVSIIGLNRISHFLTCTKVIRKILVEKNIDIILLYGAATNGTQTIRIAKEMNIPVVFRVLDIAHGLVQIPILRQLAKKYETFVLRNATKILTTTPDLARYALEMGAKTADVETFPLGINTNDFRKLSKDHKFAESIGISVDDKVIVFIGTIYGFAGLKKIISKFDFLKNKISNLKFLIIGGGPSFNELQSFVKRKKLESDVILTGFKPQQELPRYIALGDLCLNSFEINYVTNRILPTKILEYFACGKPVLSTPLRGTKELLPNEDYGIVYSTSENFVNTISELLINEQKLYDLGKKAFAYVTENHDWKILSEKIIEQFQKLIKHNS